MSTVEFTSDWTTRRKELRDLFQSDVYGQFPTDYGSASAALQETQVIRGGHTRSGYRLSFPVGEATFSIHVNLYLPRQAQDQESSSSSAYPCFLFVDSDAWQLMHVKRGDTSEYFPLTHILERGFALLDVNVFEAVPDDAKGFLGSDNLRALLGQEPDASDRLGALGIWAFTAMRAMDFLVSDPRIDSERVSVIGLSRLGKVALLTGAMDERFYLTVSVNSGHGGAALSKRKLGEQVEHITSAFPHWFAPKYKDYSKNEDALPMDQDSLLAMVAPRRLYITSSEDDEWADPLSEYRSAKLASRIYETVYKLPGLRVDGDSWDSVQTDAVYHDGYVAYHRRTGEHGLNRFDWDAVMDYIESKTTIE